MSRVYNEASFTRVLGNLEEYVRLSFAGQGSSKSFALLRLSSCNPNKLKVHKPLVSSSNEFNDLTTSRHDQKHSYSRVYRLTMSMSLVRKPNLYRLNPEMHTLSP